MICPKCGVEQEEDNPKCSHMMGRKGGKIAASRQDMREIGKLGGQKISRERGRAFYQEIGKKGGDVIAKRYSAEYFGRIGRMGGEMLKAERGHAFYQEIGKKGGQKNRELIAKAKEAKK